MAKLWSMSTTVREAERIVGFVQTALEMDGTAWNRETQIKFQVLLIKNRYYLDPAIAQSFNGLNAEQKELLNNQNVEMTYEQALGIFNAKNYTDPPFRGRASMSLLKKLGLVSTIDNVVRVTDLGRKLAYGEVSLNDFMFDALLKYQYPNPIDSDFSNWNTKPFINTLRLIKKVNELCESRGNKSKGISVLELGIFALSLRSYELVDSVAEILLEFRKQYEACVNDSAKERFSKTFIKEYLVEFKNPIKNVREYGDNVLRYLRATKYIYIRGKYTNTYIDFEPRRMLEINSILENDTGASKSFTLEEWVAYMGTYGSYELPFETISALTEILEGVDKEIAEIEDFVGVPRTEVIIPTTCAALKDWIEQRRSYRTYLQNLAIKKEFHEDVSKIDKAISAFNDILSRNRSRLDKRLSIELEKWTNIALNIINDAVLIKPNASVGDDNEPIFTAPAGVADIECYYESFGAIAEVTMLTGRDQWFNEGQPVMRHLRNFEEANSGEPSYCLFVAPTIHTDTKNTFFMSVKYEYEGRKQKIIPLTIAQLVRLLKVVKNRMVSGERFFHRELMQFYDKCSSVDELTSSSDWLPLIESNIVEIESRLYA